MCKFPGECNYRIVFLEKMSFFPFMLANCAGILISQTLRRFLKSCKTFSKLAVYWRYIRPKQCNGQP